ncbi:hypothetical protein [Pseudomonas sp. PGPR40]|uniref:hypothetical protein n=1 Tax=Pseudomonas sp. PGPR40 TaxID=2913476 RepID=UPI001ED9F8DC|nr:hypothetical protein [Pseudomonas sp. PGPR40]
MAGGGYRGILAAVPPAQRLRSASGKRGKQIRIKSQSNGNGNGNGNGKIYSFASKPAPTVDRVQPVKMGRLTSRHRDTATRQASQKNQPTSALPFTTQQAER